MDDEIPWQLFLDRIVQLCKLENMIESFKACRNDTERMTFIANNDFLNSSVEYWLSENLTKGHFSSKSSKIANKLKTDGNKAYSLGKDEKALDLYSKALIYATQCELPILLGNRSAVLYRKAAYRQCLDDIEAAIENGFPHEKIWKLYVRQGECLYALQQHRSSILALEKSIKLLDLGNFEQRLRIKDLLNHVISDEKDAKLQRANDENISQGTEGCLNGIDSNTLDSAQLIGGSNPNIPNACSLIDLHYNESEGRHIVANGDMDAGSIIIKETPYASVLLPPWYETHCQHCLQVIKYVYPCKQCTQIRYCSNRCRKDSWDCYHYFECGKLFLMEKIGIAHLALRIVLITKFNELLQENDDDISNVNKAYTSCYDSVYKLVTNSNHMVTEDLLQYSLAALLLFKLLYKGKYFFHHHMEKEKHIIIASRLLRHILQLIGNAHAVTSLSYSKSVSPNIMEEDQTRIATAIYPTTSLLNHSCEPSIINCFHRNQLVVKLAKPVKKGDRIYNCYGPHYRRMGYNERQNSLKQQYFFTCRCAHCSAGVNNEKELNSYACSSCKHKITNNACVNCSYEFDLKLTECVEKEADYQFMLALEKLNRAKDNQSIDSVLKKILYCLKSQEKIYYKSHHKLAQTYDVIAKCYAMKSEYREGLPYLRKSRVVISNQYGEQSVELTNEILKLSDIYVAIAKQYMNGQTCEDDFKLFQEGIQSIEYGLNLVNLNMEPDSEELRELNQKLDFLQSVLSS